MPNLAMVRWISYTMLMNQKLHHIKRLFTTRSRSQHSQMISLMRVTRPHIYSQTLGLSGYTNTSNCYSISRSQTLALEFYVDIAKPRPYSSSHSTLPLPVYTHLPSPSLFPYRYTYIFTCIQTISTHTYNPFHATRVHVPIMHLHKLKKWKTSVALAHANTTI